jgi:hypothetical protein
VDTHIFTTAFDTAKVEKFPVVNLVVVPVIVVIEAFDTEIFEALSQLVAIEVDDTWFDETVEQFTFKETNTADVYTVPPYKFKPDTLLTAITSVVVRILSAFILPVAEMEVADILDTDIRPLHEIFDVDKFETNADVEVRRDTNAETAVKATATERLSTDVFVRLNEFTVSVDTERLVTEKLHTLPAETNILDAEYKCL